MSLSATTEAESAGRSAVLLDVRSLTSGNVIVNIKDSRVAVNADMARHIMI